MPVAAAGGRGRDGTLESDVRRRGAVRRRDGRDASLRRCRGRRADGRERRVRGRRVRGRGVRGQQTAGRRIRERVAARRPGGADGRATRRRRLRKTGRRRVRALRATVAGRGRRGNRNTLVETETRIVHGGPGQRAPVQGGRASGTGRANRRRVRRTVDRSPVGRAETPRSGDGRGLRDYRPVAGGQPTAVGPVEIDGRIPAARRSTHDGPVLGDTEQKETANRGNATGIGRVEATASDRKSGGKTIDD